MNRSVSASAFAAAALLATGAVAVAQPLDSRATAARTIGQSRLRRGGALIIADEPSRGGHWLSSMQHDVRRAACNSAGPGRRVAVLHARAAPRGAIRLRDGTQGQRRLGRRLVRMSPPPIRVEDIARQPQFRRLDTVAGIAVDLRYAGTDNFDGRVLYEGIDCTWLREEAAAGLEAAAAWLAREAPTLRLLVLDALRPQRVQQQLLADGIAIAYTRDYAGAGPEGLLRIAVFATHTEAMIEQLVEAVSRAL